MDVVEALRGQGAACGRLGSSMYADLLGRVADDVEAGGPAAHVLRDHRDDPGPSGLALRLMGSVHRLVLERRAGDLATYYPSVGGTYEAEGCWTSFRRLLDEQPDAVEEWLDRPPQTNEVGRSAALMAGLLVLDDWIGMSIGLVEIGCSAGLNLLADRFGYVHEGGVAGPDDAPLVLGSADAPAWRGDGPWTPRASRRWPRVSVREGTDVMPIDARSTEGRLALTAYVWADQEHRHERLRGALAAAAVTPYDVRRATALETVDGVELLERSLTVVWHSVMWQYLGRDEQAAVRARLDALGERTAPDMPFAHLFLEPTRRAPGSRHEFLLVAETWHGRGRKRRILATAHSHGLPTTWEPNQ